MHSTPYTDTPIGLALELAELVRVRHPWGPWLDGIPGPQNAGDDDAGGKDGDNDGGKDGGRDRDDDRSRDDDRGKDRGKGDDDDDRGGRGRRDRGDDDRDRGKDRGKGDDDDSDTELERARQAAAKMRRERDDLKRDQEERERKSREEAGKFEDLYKTERERADRSERELGEFKSRSWATSALIKAGARNADRAVRMLDLSKIEDERDAELEVKDLKRDDPDLFSSGRRSARTRDDEDDRGDRDRGDRSDRDRGDDRDRDRDDDGDDDRDRGRRRQPEVMGPARLRRAFERSGKDKDRDRDRR